MTTRDELEAQVAEAIDVAFHRKKPLGQRFLPEARAAIAVCERAWQPGATWEQVAQEMEGMAATASASADVSVHEYARSDARSRAHAYREAAALVRARALPAMDREGLIECIGEHYDRHGDMAAPNLADAILARFAPPAPVVTPQPAQASEPARVEVGGDVERAFADAFWAGKADDGGDPWLQSARAGLRAAFAAANVVPRAELERELRRQRDDLGESYARVHDRLRADLAAATQRAETAERERDTAGACLKTLEEVLGAIGTACLEALGEPVKPQEVQPLVAEVLDRLEAAERERDEARALLAGRVTRELAERVLRVYESTHLGSHVSEMHAALSGVLGAPAAETAPAPVTREQFESLWDAVDSLRCAAHAAALDDHARKNHLRDADGALKRAKGGAR